LRRGLAGGDGRLAGLLLGLEPGLLDAGGFVALARHEFGPTTRTLASRATSSDSATGGCFGFPGTRGGQRLHAPLEFDIRNAGGALAGRP
jgi:hypothetical protein